MKRLGFIPLPQPVSKYVEIIVGPMVLKIHKGNDRTEPYMKKLREQTMSIVPALFARTVAHLIQSGHVTATHPPIYYNSFTSMTPEIWSDVLASVDRRLHCTFRIRPSPPRKRLSRVVIPSFR